MRALLYLKIGLNVAGVHVALAAFGKRYASGIDDHRVRFADVLCQAFDKALSAGREGGLDPVRAAASMDSYQRLTGAMPSIG